MKILLTITFTLLSISRLFACNCDAPFVSDNFMHSDFVALITIEKNYLNEGDNEYYKADISIQELFKGKIIKSINVYGRNDDKPRSSCAIFIPVGTKLIMYSSQGSKGYGVGMCSGLSYLEASGNSKFYIHENALKKSKKELQLLRQLKENNVRLTNKYMIRPFYKLSFELRKIENPTSKKDFAVYRIIFNSNFSINSIDTLFGFDSVLDEKIKSISLDLDWFKGNERKKIEIPDGTEYIIAIQLKKWKETDLGQLSYYF